MAPKITIIAAFILTFSLLYYSSSAQKLRVWGPKDPECLAKGGYCRLLLNTGAHHYCDKYDETYKGCSNDGSGPGYGCCLIYGRYNANEPCTEMCTSGQCGSDRVPGKCEGADEVCCVLVV